MDGFREPSWKKPATPGQVYAVDAMNNTVSPLLAGFCMAALATSVADADKFRWPGATMLAFTLAFANLIASIQLGISGRRYLYSHGDLVTWWGDSDLQDNSVNTTVRTEQEKHISRWREFHKWTGRAFNLGLAFLTAAVAIALAPPSRASASDRSAHMIQDCLRWTASGVSAIGCLLELAIIVTAWLVRVRPFERRQS
ncbi:hypothetical protein [Streptomyces sp. NPDC093568]|uniref:hypothetical protein n=1 Tax=Streptomyces sp. NPDC093568 TaxID=3366041 RepID=UPI00381B8F34